MPAEVREQVAGELNVRAAQLVSLDRARTIISTEADSEAGVPDAGWAVAAEGGEMVALDVAANL